MPQQEKQQERLSNTALFGYGVAVGVRHYEPGAPRHRRLTEAMKADLRRKARLRVAPRGDDS